ncbi:uncharacterized protein A4U43_C08F19370 [Asparagus officinalis]|nr:uncharacterized protein A4U43_C08F19370 [Asparagus officinalis]
MVNKTGKEPVPLKQEDSDGEERVDCETDNNTYLTDPDDIGFEGDIGGSSYMTSIVYFGHICVVPLS